MCVGESFTVLFGLFVIWGKDMVSQLYIDCVGCGHRHGADFVIDRPGGTRGFLLLLIKTPAVYRYEGAELPIKKNSFLLYREEQAQYYKASTEKYTDDWLHFVPETDEERELPERLGIPLGKAVYLGELEELSAIMRMIAGEFYSGNEQGRKLASIYVSAIIYKIAALLENINKRGTAIGRSAYVERLVALRADIYSAPEKKRTVDSMARELSVSRSCFQHNYKRAFGMSVIADISESRLERAKCLLISTSLSLKEIAAKCGFESDNYFMRSFKRRYGITPTSYRCVR